MISDEKRHYCLIKAPTQIFDTTQSNIDQLAKLLHWHTQNEIWSQVIIISANWTKWMAETMCSFAVCVCLCECVCVCSGPVNQTTLKWSLSGNIYKMVKAVDFKLDKRVSTESPDMIP